MSRADLRALWIYLRSRPPNGRANRPHELGLAFSRRSAIAAWKWLYIKQGPFVPDPAATAAVNRGAYLVHALGHCGAGHTPRTALGGPRSDRLLAGRRGLDGKVIPNLTPAGLAKFTDEKLVKLLSSGVTPEGDVLSDEMDLVVRFTTSQLTNEDLASMIAYLRSLPAVPAE